MNKVSITRAIRAVLLVLGVAATSISSAWAFDESGRVVAWGDYSCGQLTKNLAQGQAWEAMHEAYLQGFVTGINASVPGSSDFFAGTDSVSRLKFVAQFCVENPLSPVFAALAAMVKKITGKMPADLPPQPPQKPKKAL